MQRLHKPITAISSTNRSRVTNGTALLMGVDGRSPAARRFRDLMRGFEAEFVVASELDRGLIRQAAMLALKSEQLQAALVRGEAVRADTITKIAGQIRRVLADLKHKAGATATPVSIHEHLSRHDNSAQESSADEDGG